MLRRDGKETALAGNIGTALSAMCASRAPRWFVIEVSSFQLETIDRFRPDVAVVTNITPDHLDRHGGFEGYAAAKARVFENQGGADAAVLNEDDPASRKLSPPARRIGFSARGRVPGGVYAEGETLWSEISGARRPIADRAAVALPGLHNLENALASAAAAELAGASAPAVASALVRFTGLRHRTELVAQADGVAWIDDSKGTNPDAVVKSLAGFPDGRVILILGGSEKGSDFAILSGPAAAKARLVLTIGQSAEKIERALSGVKVQRAGTMERAVARRRRGASGNTVLLSPACASFITAISRSRASTSAPSCSPGGGAARKLASDRILFARSGAGALGCVMIYSTSAPEATRMFGNPTVSGQAARRAHRRAHPGVRRLAHRPPFPEAVRGLRGAGCLARASRSFFVRRSTRRGAGSWSVRSRSSPPSS
jgi:hypothetical protein